MIVLSMFMQQKYRRFYFDFEILMMQLCCFIL